MRTLTPFLWFQGRAEEAANFYVSVFADSRIRDVMRWAMDGPGARKGDVLSVDFEIEGRRFCALNGNAEFPFTPAVSFMVEVETQDELDTLWERLLADGGRAMACGWLTDRFGVSWQVTPRRLLEWMRDPDTAKAQRTCEAMMRMVKLDIGALERAHDGA